MPRTRTALQQNLTVDVWRLSELRTALLRQLADVEEQQRQAITIAAMHSVRQNVLAETSGLTEARVSRIVNQTVLPETAVDELRTLWGHTLDFPADHFTRCQQPATQADVDRWNRRHELVHGETGTLTLDTTAPPDA